MGYGDMHEPLCTQGATTSVTKKRIRPVTQEDMAERLGVSVGTVSAVLSGKARQRRIGKATERRIRKLAEELDYVPNQLAQGLRKSATRNIGVIFVNFELGWSQRILNGMLRVLDEADYTPSLMYHAMEPHREARIIESMFRERVDGILVIPFEEGVPNYRKVLDRGVPLAFFADVIESMPDVNYVTWESGEAAREAVEQLIAVGRKRIAYLGLPDLAGERSFETQMDRLRYEGYCAAVRAHDLPAPEDFIVWLARNPDGQVEQLRALLSDPARRPDAFLVQNDSCAIKILEILSVLGVKVPEEVAVAGMGDLHAAGLHGVGLSTMREPCEEIGAEAASIILRMTEEPGYRAQRRIVANEFRARTTTGHTDWVPDL